MLRTRLSFHQRDGKLSRFGFRVHRSCFEVAVSPQCVSVSSPFGWNANFFFDQLAMAGYCSSMIRSSTTPPTVEAAPGLNKLKRSVTPTKRSFGSPPAFPTSYHMSGKAQPNERTVGDPKCAS